jgi:hypothetical protein
MSEHDEQVLFFTWVEANIPLCPELWGFHAIPNGAKCGYSVNRQGKRFSPQGKFLKDEGRKPGVLDTFLPVPRQGYHGLYIEMKFGKNTLSDEQKAFIEFVESQGFCCRVCYSAEAARDESRWYLDFYNDYPIF